MAFLRDAIGATLFRAASGVPTILSSLVRAARPNRRAQTARSEPSRMAECPVSRCARRYPIE
jgi:hypothetical protein